MKTTAVLLCTIGVLVACNGTESSAGGAAPPPQAPSSPIAPSPPPSGPPPPSGAQQTVPSMGSKSEPDTVANAMTRSEPDTAAAARQATPRATSGGQARPAAPGLRCGVMNVKDCVDECGPGRVGDKCEGCGFGCERCHCVPGASSPTAMVCCSRNNSCDVGPSNAFDWMASADCARLSGAGLHCDPSRCGK